MKRPEDTIQKSIVRYLRTVAPHCLTFAVPNGGYRTITEARRLKETGVLAGIPDLCVIEPGGVARFFEVKAPEGRLSPAQREMNDRLMRSCISYAVVHNIEEVRVSLQAWKIETREANPVQGE